MDPALPRPSIWGRRGWQIAIWLCLISAFSPVLLDLTIHVSDNAWARTILIFPWLVWVASRQNVESSSLRSRPVSHRIIWAWLLAGIAIELVSIVVASVIGRVTDIDSGAVAIISSQGELRSAFPITIQR